MKIEITVPDGKIGQWSVESFEVKKNELSQVISMFKIGRGVPEGIYKRLMRGKECIMSNTPDEIRDFAPYLKGLKGSVLINGLGLGVTVKYLLNNSNITNITVIEKSEDVIKLVSPTYKDKRLNIIHCDCFEYKPPKGIKYDFVWHDIWDYICSDNLEEMKTLHRKYGKKSYAQASWCRYECQKQFNEDKKYMYY